MFEWFGFRTPNKKTTQTKNNQNKYGSMQSKETSQSNHGRKNKKFTDPKDQKYFERSTKHSKFLTAIKDTSKKFIEILNDIYESQNDADKIILSKRVNSFLRKAKKLGRNINSDQFDELARNLCIYLKDVPEEEINIDYYRTWTFAFLIGDIELARAIFEKTPPPKDYNDSREVSNQNLIEEALFLLEISGKKDVGPFYVNYKGEQPVLIALPKQEEVKEFDDPNDKGKEKLEDIDDIFSANYTSTSFDSSVNSSKFSIFDEGLDIKISRKKRTNLILAEPVDFQQQLCAYQESKESDNPNITLFDDEENIEETVSLNYEYGNVDVTLPPMIAFEDADTEIKQKKPKVEQDLHKIYTQQPTPKSKPSVEQNDQLARRIHININQLLADIRSEMNKTNKSWFSRSCDHELTNTAVKVLTILDQANKQSNNRKTDITARKINAIKTVNKTVTEALNDNSWTSYFFRTKSTVKAYRNVMTTTQQMMSRY